MKTRHLGQKIAILICLTLALNLSWSRFRPDVAMAQDARTESIVLVQFAPDVTPAERERLIAQLGGQLLQWLPAIHTARVQLPQARSLPITQHSLDSPREDRRVTAVEFDGRVEGLPTTEDAGSGNSTIPAHPLPEHPLDVNDPDFNNLDHVYAPHLLQVPLAWHYTQGDPDIVVAVVDSGVRADHPDLTGRVLSGYDFVNDDPIPNDDHGHGTHISGIIAAAADNGIGSAGICPNCSILPVKVLDANNVGTWSNVAAGIVYAADNGARVINLSLGGGSRLEVMQAAIDYAVEQGVLVVTAAGNGRSDTPFYPAAYEKVLAIGATDADDDRWSLSNYGDWLDLVAPGRGIFSTYNDLSNYYGGYTYMSGTSMAAPHASALAGLLLSQDSQRTVSDLNRLLTTTAIDLGTEGKDVYFGHGRIDALSALSADSPAPVADGRMGGRVWQDQDGDGRWDEHESFLAESVVIEVLDEQHRPVTSANSDQNGYWAVDQMLPGIYTVRPAASEQLRPTGIDEYRVDIRTTHQRYHLDFGLQPSIATDAFAPQAIYVPAVLHGK